MDIYSSTCSPSPSISSSVKTASIASSKTKKGLENLGNTCYLASLLQCFSSITSQKQSIITNTTSKNNLSSRVLSVCQQLAKDGTLVRSWVPSLINKWETFCGYGSGQQQNVIEAFENLHQLLQNDKIIKKDTFNPVLITHFKCQKCQKVSNHFNESCCNIVINASSPHKGLSSLFATEILDGKNNVYCDECKEKCCAARWEEMAAFPEVPAICHECTETSCSAPSKTFVMETDRVNQRSFCKGFSNDNFQHLLENYKEVYFYHFVGQILHKQLDQRNGHYIAVIKRNRGNDVSWNICNDADVTELNIENWTKAWKDLYAQGYNSSLSFYTKEKTKPTFSTIQFGGSSSSSETSNNNTLNNTSTTTTPSSSSPFITPSPRTTSISQLSSSITSSYGLEALNERKKKTCIFSPNEKRLIFKPKTKLWKEFSEETNIKVSLSHFYKLTTNFSKAKR
ncbi:uncharacterized protein MONOS_16548 [Monocercomonoides exilis]|uniref:uncharacterized protein n=1 Tax=Monocercomonoides exilis TaxID=2049356 RepID=UPI003559472D|nr:hypothetical protein MONOS_16548 [Monocercomonoides exilis]|eukprot:MONOS_16548.1-p1 / transcript=MONOS_16548.1 / gene=MONOS_16548 / organism=Monocercomonoides_exilis_PA203 / gene_product=unspecified product / transcript_product=unspecified product / location=Mono_scaffold01854:66-1427(+) / protein_length=453 / sequence_SO=supercontig / SO=protein_coding / is_pseudo=false